jgi:hypothetical protein
MAGMRGTHPLLSRLCDVLVGLEQPAKIQSLPAPEVSVDAPVEGELQGAPVEASARRSAAARSGRHGRGAHKTWIRELMATQSWGAAAAVEGESVVGGRNASSIGWHCGVEALRLLPSGSGGPC